MTKKPGITGRAYNAFILFFLYAPILVLVVFSFNNSKNTRSSWTGFTFDWYISLFRDTSVINAFYTTIIIALLSAVIATIAGTFAAVGFHNMRKQWRTPLMHINNIPLMNADIVTGVSLTLLFISLGSIFKFSLGFTTLLLAHITFNIPYVVLSIMPKLKQLDADLVDAACDLGCTWMQAFWKVIVPEIMPGIINGLIIAFTVSVDDFVISYFTSGGNIMTLPMKVFAMTRRRISPEINALSTILFLAVLALLLVINIRQSRQEEKFKQHRRIQAQRM